MNKVLSVEESVKRSKAIYDKYGWVEVHLYRRAWTARVRKQRAQEIGANGRAPAEISAAYRELMGLIGECSKIQDFHDWVREDRGEEAYQDIHGETQRRIEQALRAS